MISRLLCLLGLHAWEELLPWGEWYPIRRPVPGYTARCRNCNTWRHS
jgi:hypothetical protein